MRRALWVIVLCGAASACGREPSRLLRQGQLPIYDFPLYLTEGVTGNVYKLDRDRSKTLVASGLSDPRGIATDRFGRVYVAEFGAGRLLELDPDGGEPKVMLEGLDAPSIVAVDSFGEVYVTQDGTADIMRASDKKVFAKYSVAPTALVFGVDDIPVVGLYDAGKVVWGWEEDATGLDFEAPINASIDGTGRVYVAEGSAAGKVVRYHQRAPDDGTLVADNLIGPAGIAVDPVGNIFLVEQGAGRIVMISYDGIKYAWITDVTDPQYLAFTQY